MESVLARWRSCAGVAFLVPVRRASTVDPITVLR